jgi:hypothetical protein
VLRHPLQAAPAQVGQVGADPFAAAQERLLVEVSAQAPHRLLEQGEFRCGLGRSLVQLGDDRGRVEMVDGLDLDRQVIADEQRPGGGRREAPQLADPGLGDGEHPLVRPTVLNDLPSPDQPVLLQPGQLGVELLRRGVPEIGNTHVDAYSAEMMVSVLVGMMLQVGLDRDLLTSALLDVVDKLARRGLAHDYLGLRTLAVVGQPEISGTAAQAAEGIAAAAERIGGAPAWAAQLGQVTPGACVVLADAYGETQTLLCEFAYVGGARAHQVRAVLDATWHGSVVALTIADEPGQARQLLDKQARRDGTSVREIPAPEAGRRLRAGIDAFLRHGQPPGTGQEHDAYGDLCAALSVARHRAATLAGIAGPQSAPIGVAALWPQDVRLRVAEEFLASPPGAGSFKAQPPASSPSCSSRPASASSAAIRWRPARSCSNGSCYGCSP